MKKERLHRQHRKTKEHKRLSGATNDNKMIYLEEMDRFLEKFNLPKLNRKK